jgi:hypothetical protein
LALVSFYSFYFFLKLSFFLLLFTKTSLIRLSHADIVCLKLYLVPGIIFLCTYMVCILTGVWVSLSRHSPNWQVVQYLHSPSRKITDQKYREGKRGKKPSPDWRVGLYFYSPILNCTLIWQVGERLSAPLIII